MNVDAFIAERDAQWSELDEIVTEARRRPQRLGATRVRRLGALYRSTAADLAVARRRWPRDPVVARLERLVVRARPLVYTGDGRGGRMWDFVRRDMWRRIRERPAILALATVLLVGAVALTALWAWRDPQQAAGYVPSQYRTVADPHHFDARRGPSVSVDTALAAQIMTNNIRVTFFAFGGGLLLGVPTIFVLLQNGALLGVLLGLAGDSGNGSPFVELIVPHGVLELSCIIVSAAAGLRVAWAVIAPGHRPRLEAVRDEARAAIAMIVGASLCLVVAGLVEGFITPHGIGVGPAIALGGALGAGFWIAVFVLGRPPHPDAEATTTEAVAAATEAQSLADSFSLK